jgi:hypothetical protein
MLRVRGRDDPSSRDCEHRSHPHHPRQRYCSDACREAARKWSRWRPNTDTVRQKRARRNGTVRAAAIGNGSRKSPEPEAVGDAARVITTEDFVRAFVRPGESCFEITSEWLTARGPRYHHFTTVSALECAVLKEMGESPSPPSLTYEYSSFVLGGLTEPGRYYC